MDESGRLDNWTSTYDIVTYTLNPTPDIEEGTTVLSAPDTITSAVWIWDEVAWAWWEILQVGFSVLGMAGNLLVMTVLVQRRASRKSADTLVGALAAADFITSLFMLPHPKPKTVPDTFFGRFTCKIILSSVFMWVSIMASVFILTAISVEKYIAVVHPLLAKLHLTPSRTRMCVGSLWLISFVLNCQSFVVTTVDPLTHDCTVRYKSVISQKIFGVCVIVIFFLLPVSIMLITQILTAMELHRQSISFADDHRNRTDTSNPAYNILRAKKRVVRVLSIVVIVYIGCWAPDHFAFLAFNLQWLDASFLYSPLYRGLVALAFFNSCVNPIVYGVNYPQFRAAIRETLWRSSTSKTRPSLFGPDMNSRINVSKSSIDMHNAP